MLRAWTHQDKFQEGTNLSAWLYTILRNTHISYIRKAQREQEKLERILELRRQEKERAKEKDRRISELVQRNAEHARNLLR